MPAEATANDSDAPPAAASSKRRTAAVRRVVLAVAAPIAGLALVYGAWAFAAWQVENPVLLPPPASVLAALADILADELVFDILASLRHLGAGMAIGVSIGFALAFVAASIRPIAILIDPLVELLRPISGIAWIPLAILMFGVGETVPIFLIAYVSVFPIFINTLAGVRGVDPNLIAAARVLGATPLAIQRRVVLPAATPMIFSGLRLSLGVSWMTLIGAELIGADSGLGWRAYWYEQFFALDKTMAVILVVGILGYAFDAILRAIQTRLLRWSPDHARSDGS